MMDPKMDAGMVCNQVQRDVYTLDSAVEVTIDFVTANLGDVWHGLGVGVVVVVGGWGVGKQQQERYVYNPSKCYAPYLVLCLRRLEMITMKSSFKSTGDFKKILKLCVTGYYLADHYCNSSLFRGLCLAYHYFRTCYKLKLTIYKLYE